MDYSILFSCISHIGKCRSINQDNLICNGQHLSHEHINEPFSLSGRLPTSETPVFGVFDGMGGEECGEIASLIAAENAANLHIGKNAIAEITQFCFDANVKICQYAQEHDIGSMGTTAAMLVFAQKGIILCNIGDSKVFRYSDGTLEQISQDHVAVAAFGSKPPLSQNLGIPPDELIIEPYVARGKYHNGDIYLICSDGLTDMLSQDEIRGILATFEYDAVVPTLLDISLEKGGKDNITIIMCKVERVPLRLIDKLKELIRRVKKHDK